MSEETCFHQINDAIYAYQVSGQGNPVVLLHGFTGSSATWDSFVAKTESEFQLITIDLPGHGNTTTESPRTMEACCDDLAKLFAHLNLPQFHLIGYSMGGRTALSFALTYPESILSLVLESASPGIRGGEERIERIKADEKIAQIISSMGIDSFVDYWENIPLFATQRKLSLSQQQAIRNERLAQSESGLAQSLRMMGTGSQPSWWDMLIQFVHPVLLIVGEKDKKFVNINKEMKVRFKNADMIVVKDTGHAIHIEKPDEFAHHVKRFISVDR